MQKDRDELRKLAYGTLRLVREFKLAQNRRSDLDRVTFEILMLVRLRKQIRPSDIASELDFNPSSITRRIQSLKRSGHITVIADPADLRSSMISITEVGEEMLVQFLERSVDGLERILKQWNDDEVRSFTFMLFRFADAMSERRLKAPLINSKE